MVRTRTTCNHRDRRLAIEPLEQRTMLSAGGLTATVLGKEVPIPDWIPAERIAAVRASMERITFTGSTAPVYPSTAESADLIGMGTFRAEPEYVGVDGSGFAVVVLDTGIDLDHPFFGPDDDEDGVADRIVYQYDFAEDDDDASAPSGASHGSNVTSIAAGFQQGVYSGIAPGADIIHLKVFEDDGDGNFTFIEAALDWVVDNAATYNIAAVNMSLGNQSYHTTPTTGGFGIDDELAALKDMDVIVVSASGNAYKNSSGDEQVGVAYPSADPNSLSVGAVWDADNGGPWVWSGQMTDHTTGADRIISFSQRHETMSDIFAPGGTITGADWNGGTIGMEGTSQASPHIAGVAVLAQELAVEHLGQRLTLAEFRDLLSDTGVVINDGDDEDDNVVNTDLDFARVDMVALANAIVPPTVSDKTPDDSATIYSSSINVDVTFSEEVTGVDASDLVVSGTGGGGATVGTPTDLGGNVWRFPLSGLVIGAVDISLAPDAGDITDTASNNLAPVTWSYTASAPTAAVLSLAAPLATEVELTWTDSVGESDYYVYDGAYLITVAANSTGYTVTGLVPDTQHNFLVVAKNSLGTTNSGPYQQINTPPLMAPPFTIEAVAPDSVRVDWEDSNGETSFRIYRFNYNADDTPDGNPNWEYIADWPSGVGPRSVTFSGLTPDRLVGYQVKATAPNNTTAYNPQQTLRTPKANTPVPTLTPVSPTSVRLDWPDAAGEDNYYVYRFNYDASEVYQGYTFLATRSANTISYTATGLTVDRLVKFQVKSVYTSSTVNSAKIAITTPKLDEPVVSVSVVSASEVDLDWTDSSGETGYEVYRYDYDQTGALGSTLVATPGAGVLTYTDSNLNADWYYEYQVKAVYPGSTVNSDRVAARTPAALLLAEADRATEVNDPTVADDRQLAALIDEAIRRWAEAGIDPLVVARLQQTEVRIENLPEDFLGLAYSDSGVIVLDDDAAGRGWFIDPTPADDEEFSAASLHREMIALPGGPADDAVDLLTAVMHEMGHVLGFGHEGGHYSMSESLASGLRRLPHFDEPVPIYDLAL